MKILTSKDVHKYIEAQVDPNKLLNVYGLSLFCSHAFYSSDFEPDSVWKDCITFTKYADHCIKKASSEGLCLDDNQVAFVLFCLFQHHEQFIDHTKTDIGKILTLLNTLQKEGKMRWPYVFGNRLYHKFNDHFNSPVDYLEADEVNSFLDGTPHGIFQIGNIVSGPIGFLVGLDQRIIPPTLQVHLWHCSDPGCRASHDVSLTQYPLKIIQAIQNVHTYFVRTFGMTPNWTFPIFSISRKKWSAGRPFIDIPPMISDCIIHDERTSLLIRCLKSKHNQFLMNVIEKYGKSAGDPSGVASTLTPEEQHQLILLLPDVDIINFIDELIAKKEIHIPPAEIREPRSYVYRQEAEHRSQISPLGITSAIYPEIIELASAIWQTYEEFNQIDDLIWRLRGYEGSTVRHSIIDFIQKNGPEKTVGELILASRAITSTILTRYNLQMFDKELEINLTKRLLWKMGFCIASYEETYTIFFNRIREFKTCVLEIGKELIEADKAKIRGAGVNLFVSVENFLEELICYNVWMLASDHLNDTDYVYRRDDAHLAVIRTLGERIESGTQTFTWSSDGSNAIGTLLTYLQGYRSWLYSLTDDDRTSIKKDESEYPHFAKDPVRVFPFRHKHLWADIHPDIFSLYSSFIDTIFTKLAKAELAMVRNGLDHKRDDDKFPDADKMLACAARLEEVMDFADKKRLIPKLYWLTQAEQDSYGNICKTFSDYRGSKVSLWSPSPVISTRGIFRLPCLIAPLDFFNQPNAILIFGIHTNSLYAKYWDNYPRKLDVSPKIAAVQ